MMGRESHAKVFSTGPRLTLFCRVLDVTRRPSVWIVIAILILLGGQVFFFRVTSDDAFISLRYAENFARGWGLVFNEGERVEGYSNFLWVIILAGFARVGLTGIMVPKILGVILGVASLLETYVLAVSLNPRGRLWNVLPCLLLATSVQFVVWSVAGLEEMLFVFLILIAAHLYVRELLDPDLLPLSSVIFLLLALTRPEGVIFLVAAALLKIGLTARTLRGGGLQASGRLAMWLIVFVLGFAVYLLWRWTYYGDIVPNTFYAKTGQPGFNQQKQGLSYLWRFIAFDNLLLLAGLACLPFMSTRQKSTIGYVALLFFVVSYTAFVVYVGGDGMAVYRFFVPVLPLCSILASHGLATVADAFSSYLSDNRETRIRITMIAMSFGLLYAMFIVGQAYVVWLKDNGSGLGFGSRQGLRDGLEGQNCYAKVGHYLKRTVRSDALIAVWDAGAVPYYSGLRTLDMWSLMDRNIARLEHLARLGKVQGDSGALLRDYILGMNPTYFVGCSTVSPAMLAEERLLPYGLGKDDRLLQKYRLVWRELAPACYVWLYTQEY